MMADDYVKYLTERFVNYLETPRNERKAAKQAKERWHQRWFGMIPESLKMMFSRYR